MKTGKCFFYQKQLYLYRAGELSEQEQDRLNKHLASCPECAVLGEKLKSLDRNIEQLCEEQPVPDNPVALTNNIMHAVTSFSKIRQYKDVDTAGSILKLVFAPRLRFALLATIVFVISLFLIQEALFMGRIAKLERKISMNTAQGIYLTGKMNYSALESKLISLDKSGSLSPNWFMQIRIKTNDLVVDEKSLTVLLENYKSVKIQNKLLLELLKNKNPDLYHMTIQNGLDQAEIQKLLSNKKEILQFINEL